MKEPFPKLSQSKEREHLVNIYYSLDFISHEIKSASTRAHTDKHFAVFVLWRALVFILVFYTSPMETRDPFLEGPETKISKVKFTELFFSHIFNINKVYLHASFMPILCFVFKIWIAKMASQARKVFGTFEKLTPGQVRLATYCKSENVNTSSWHFQNLRWIASPIESQSSVSCKSKALQKWIQVNNIKYGSRRVRSILSLFCHYVILIVTFYSITVVMVICEFCVMS